MQIGSALISTLENREGEIFFGRDKQQDDEKKG